MRHLPPRSEGHSTGTARRSAAWQRRYASNSSASGGRRGGQGPAICPAFREFRSSSSCGMGLQHVAAGGGDSPDRRGPPRGAHAEQTVMLWIESGAGKITRGHVDSIGAEGVRVRIAEEPDFSQGDEVAVRVCFDRGAPTVAVKARIDWLSCRRRRRRVRAALDRRRRRAGRLDAWLATPPEHGTVVLPGGSRSSGRRDRLRSACTPETFVPPSPGRFLRGSAPVDRRSCPWRRRSSGSRTCGSSGSPSPGGAGVRSSTCTPAPSPLVHTARTTSRSSCSWRALRDLRRDILLEGDLEATPRTNAAFLGPRGDPRLLRRHDGGSMLLIAPAADEPGAQARRPHRRLLHLPRLQIGGCLTPLGTRRSSSAT